MDALDKPTLDPEELAALRGAIQEANSGSPLATSTRRVAPVALIADDRAAERARPVALRLAQRWTEGVPARLFRLCGARLEVEQAGAEIVDGAALRDELSRNWVQGIEVVGRPGVAALSASGPIIELLAARLLGGAADEIAADRAPSATARRLFAPVGEAIFDALADAWREEQQCELRRLSPLGDGWRALLATSDPVLALTVAFAGPISGRILLLARAETVLPPPAPPRLLPAPPGAIDEVLGAVPIQVRVELGRTRLTMSELGALRPGAVLVLREFVDELLPVSLGGVVKAFGRAILVRGALAVEIAAEPEQARRR